MKSFRLNPDIILVLFICFNNSYCMKNIKFSSENTTVVQSLVNCAQTLIRNNFVTEKIIALYSANDNETNNMILHEILADISAGLRYTFATSCLSQKPAYYTVVSTTVHDFRMFVEAEKSCPHWSSTAKFLIIVADMNLDSKEYFRTAWNYNLHNTIIMFYNNSINDVNILAWNPMELCHFDYKPFQNVHTRKCFDTPLFIEDISKQFSGCSLKVGVNAYPPFASRTSTVSYLNGINFDSIDQYDGAEIELLKYACKKFNLTVELITTSDSTAIDIDKETFINMLAEKKLDLVLGDITMKYFETNKFEFTYPHYHDEIHAFIKKQSYIDMIEELIQLFELKIIIFCSCIFIVSFILYVGILCFNGIFRNTSDVVGGCLSALAINIGQPAILPSRIRSFSTLLIVLWIWMSFYGRTVYQSALIKIIWDEKSQNYLNTIQDVCENHMTIIVPDITDMRLLYANRSYSDNSCMFRRDDFVECADVYDCFKYVLRQPNFATFISVNFYNSEKWKVLGQKDYENEDFYYINDLIFASPLSFQFRQGSPFVSFFSDVGIRFVETGLLQRSFGKIHNKELLLRSRFIRNKKQKYLKNHSCKTLTMAHVQQFFYIYLGGCLLSIICALLEILFFYFTKMRKYNMNRRQTSFEWSR